jgi:F-type H+-transporting ATPase subunit a
MPEQLPFTALLNRAFAGPADWLLRLVHIEPKYPQAPIGNPVAMQILVVGFLIIVFVIARLRLSAENPGGLQHIFEGLRGFIQGQSEEIIGHHSQRFTAFLASLFIFILICNLIGVIPGFESPTAAPVVPLGCAIVAFFYYQYHGVRTHRAKYVAHFIGPQDKDMPIVMRILLPVLMFPIEIVSHLARVMSLTIRLFANMFAGDMVTLVFFSLIPIILPIAFLGLHIFVSLLQAYIFVLLTMVYLQGAVASEH